MNLSEEDEKDVSDLVKEVFYSRNVEAEEEVEQGRECDKKLQEENKFLLEALNECVTKLEEFQEKAEKMKMKEKELENKKKEMTEVLERGDFMEMDKLRNEGVLKKKEQEIKLLEEKIRDLQKIISKKNLKNKKEKKSVKQFRAEIDAFKTLTLKQKYDFDRHRERHELELRKNHREKNVVQKLIDELENQHEELKIENQVLREENKELKDLLRLATERMQTLEIEIQKKRETESLEEDSPKAMTQFESASISMESTLVKSPQKMKEKVRAKRVADESGFEVYTFPNGTVKKVQGHETRIEFPNGDLRLINTDRKMDQYFFAKKNVVLVSYADGGQEWNNDFI
eukprot:augustus_masked-scaffold_9-processed-gene-9.43-mRNA-1 protein AED:1.00 eAED:1.00 QI:0/-1/0/0/-1/1/1/0/342